MHYVILNACDSLRTGIRTVQCSIPSTHFLQRNLPSNLHYTLLTVVPATHNLPPTTSLLATCCSLLANYLSHVRFDPLPPPLLAITERMLTVAPSLLEQAAGPPLCLFAEAPPPHSLHVKQMGPR